MLRKILVSNCMFHFSEQNSICFWTGQNPSCNGNKYFTNISGASAGVGKMEQAYWKNGQESRRTSEGAAVEIYVCFVSTLHWQVSICVWLMKFYQLLSLLGQCQFTVDIVMLWLKLLILRCIILNSLWQPQTFSNGFWRTFYGLASNFVPISNPNQSNGNKEAYLFRWNIGFNYWFIRIYSCFFEGDFYSDIK